MLVSSVQGAEIAQTTIKASADTQKAGSALPTQAFYFSPALVIDPKSGTDVLEYRNTSTGAVTNQYPSEKDLKAYSQNSETAALVAKAAAPVEVTTPAKPAATDAVTPAPAQPAAATSNSTTEVVV